MRAGYEIRALMHAVMIYLRAAAVSPALGGSRPVACPPDVKSVVSSYTYFVKRLIKLGLRLGKPSKAKRC